jgi:hypothetical protein
LLFLSISALCTSSKLRIFADNNRTECQYCSQTNHPSYRCVRKPSMAKTQACFRCNSKDHTIKDCHISHGVYINIEGNDIDNSEVKILSRSISQHVF